MPTKEELQRRAISAYARELNVPEDLALGVGGQESSFNDAAISPKGAKGTMQVMDDTSADMAPKYGPDRRRQGVGYLGERLADPDFSGELSKLDDPVKRQFALAAYNGGPGTLAKARKEAKKLGLDPNDFDVVSAFLPEETQAYVPGVLGRVGGTSVTAGRGVQSVEATPVPSDDDPEAELMALAGGEDPEAELNKLAQAAPTEKRSLGANVYDRTVGRFSRAADAALGGLPSAAAGFLGAKSAGDEAGAQEALTRGGGTGERLLGVGTGALETGLTAAFPGAAAAATAAGIGAEEAFDDPGAGDTAELVVGGGQAAAGLGRAAVRGGKALLGGRSAAEDVIEGLGAQRTAQDVGRELQAPGGGAREAISTTARESSDLYDEAGRVAKAAGATASPTDLGRAARQAVKDAKDAGTPLTGPTRRIVAQVLQRTRGKKSKILGPAGTSARTPAGPVPVDELIEIQSNLRREISKLPYNHGGRRGLIELSKKMDDVMGTSTANTPTGAALGKARQHYRETTIPTRKSADRVSRAETPEQATRVLTGAKTPSRFERVTKGSPSSAEPVRSAFFNDLVESAKDGSNVNLRRLAKALEKAEGSGQLKNMANTPGRANTIRAVKKAAKFQRSVQRAPLGLGALAGTSTGFFGLGAGYAAGSVLKAAVQSERASRALLRLASARQGSPGWKAAAKAFKKIVGPGAAATTARATGQAREKNDGND